jgi:DNA-binding NtrC family response regulator
MPSDPRPVLVADDDAAVRRLVEMVLGRAGYAVTAAAGKQALALLTDPSRGFAAAVVGEGLTAPQVLARVRPACPDLPVVVMTGGPDAPTVQAVRSDPHATFLPKPFWAATLTRTVEKVVGGHES